MKKLFLAALGMSAFLFINEVRADDWGNWQEYRTVNGVITFYRIKADEDAVYVQWKCQNLTSVPKSCSIGGGESKRYRCTKGYGSGVLGETRALGEKEFLRPNQSFVFGSEPACRGLGASNAWPDAKVVVVNEG